VTNGVFPSNYAFEENWLEREAPELRPISHVPDMLGALVAFLGSLKSLRGLSHFKRTVNLLFQENV
jgi:hypothetical protein